MSAAIALTPAMDAMSLVPAAADRREMVRQPRAVGSPRRIGEIMPDVLARYGLDGRAPHRSNADGDGCG